MGKQGVVGLFGLAAQLRVVSWRELGVGSVGGKSEKKFQEKVN